MSIQVTIRIDEVGQNYYCFKKTKTSQQKLYERGLLGAGQKH